MTKPLFLTASIALSLVPLTALADNVRVTSITENDRVLLIATNIKPDTPAVLERVLIPTSLRSRKGNHTAAAERTIAVNALLQPETKVDLGSIEQVFDANSPPGQTVAELRQLRAHGMDSCRNRNVPVTLHVRYGQLVRQQMTSITVTWCIDRVE